jgi:hypothetical protein
LKDGLGLTLCIPDKQKVVADRITQPDLMLGHASPWAAVRRDRDPMTPAGRVVPVWMNERSMFLFNPQNRLRLVMKRVIAHRIYRVSNL